MVVDWAGVLKCSYFAMYLEAPVPHFTGVSETGALKLPYSWFYWRFIISITFDELPGEN